VTVNSENQITNSGFTYDSAGDMTSTGDHSYTYDGEGRITSAGTATYTYDGDSLRVEKIDTGSPSSNRLYWRGYDERVLAETDTAGNAQKEFIFFAGRRIAYYSNSTASHYYFYQDLIGSVRAITNAAGSTNAYTADYYPWGLPQSMTETGIDNRYRWAGQEYDPEVLHYAFPYRTYTPQRGRFMSPDPVSGSSSSPQSWDRYSYVQNSPLNATDPLGKMMIKDGNDWDNGDGDGGYEPDFSPPFDGGAGDSGAALSDDCGDGQATICVVSVLKNQPANDPSDPVPPAPDPQTFPTVVPQPIMIATQPNPPLQPKKPEPKKPSPNKVHVIGPGKSKPNVPPDRDFCSIYRDGTGAGDALYQICMHTPDSEWGNCVRGNLMQQFTPRDNPADLIFRYVLFDHPKDFAACAGK
jgi:RHS repeat-associated protein